MAGGRYLNSNSNSTVVELECHSTSPGPPKFKTDEKFGDMLFRLLIHLRCVRKTKKSFSFGGVHTNQL